MGVIGNQDMDECNGQNLVYAHHETMKGDTLVRLKKGAAVEEVQTAEVHDK